MHDPKMREYPAEALNLFLDIAVESLRWAADNNVLPVEDCNKAYKTISVAFGTAMGLMESGINEKASDEMRALTMTVMLRAYYGSIVGGSVDDDLVEEITKPYPRTAEGIVQFQKDLSDNIAKLATQMSARRK